MFEAKENKYNKFPPLPLLTKRLAFSSCKKKEEEEERRELLSYRFLIKLQKQICEAVNQRC